VKIDDFIKNKKIIAYLYSILEEKTVDDILVVESTKSTKPEMLAILTRLGKGKIIINGDLEQQDTRDSMTGLAYAIELSKQIEGIEWIKLKKITDLI
jgi:phosphate starvation-inducible protein PhoH